MIHQYNRLYFVLFIFVFSKYLVSVYLPDWEVVPPGPGLALMTREPVAVLECTWVDLCCVLWWEVGLHPTQPSVTCTSRTRQTST